jgi:death on curing protein
VNYLTTDEVIRLHERAIQRSGGSAGIRDRGLIDSAVFQPQATFGGQDLLPTIVEKASALGFSLAMNHAFVDGNKRIAHAAMETFLVINDHQLSAGVDEQEATILQLASGAMSRQHFEEWVRSHIVPMPQSPP